MEGIKNNLMYGLCRPDIHNEIMSRFNNLDSSRFHFINPRTAVNAIVSAERGGVHSTFDDGRGIQLSYTALQFNSQAFGDKTPGITSICEIIAFWSGSQHELVVKKCSDAPFVGRVYREACENYQTVKTSSYIPQTIGIIAGVGAALSAYQNYKTGNYGRAIIWAAISTASIALPHIYS